jgi:hypothetical protein
MFCPLCHAEFRDGFTQCSDCRLALVASLDDPNSSRARLWKGARQAELDRILRALDEHEIPCHFKELVNTSPRMQILGIRLGAQRPTFEYEVWIFRLDLDRARAAIHPPEPHA